MEAHRVPPHGAECYLHASLLQVPPLPTASASSSGPPVRHRIVALTSVTPVKLWITIGCVALVLNGPIIQFRYADRWDYGKAGRPGKSRTVPEDRIPNIHPDADAESFTGYGYVERPKAEEAEVTATATATDEPTEES